MTKNPHKPGDLCTMVHSNGAGEGVIWIVETSNGAYVRIRPAFTTTGVSVLRTKRVMFYNVDPLSLLQLCELRRKFDEFIQDIVKQRGGGGTVDPQKP